MSVVMPELRADTIIHNGTIWCGYEEGTVEARQSGKARF